MFLRNAGKEIPLTMGAIHSSETLLNNYHCLHVSSRPKDEGTFRSKCQKLNIAVSDFHVTTYTVQTEAVVGFCQTLVKKKNAMAFSPQVNYTDRPWTPLSDEVSAQFCV
jgi:hypothetical protein